MTNVAVYPVSWAGSPVVGPSVSVFHVFEADVDAFAPRIRAFYNSVASVLATGVQISFPTAGQSIDDTSGEVVGVWSATAQTAVSGSGGTAFTNGVGTRVKWFTGGFAGGRKVTGATFLVPLSNPNFEGAGNITSACLSVISGAATTLITSPLVLGVYSRPAPGRSGRLWPVLGTNVPDAVSWLRSRRT